VTGIFSAWGKILLGYQPFLSIEITRECPLACPGCYVYQPDHLGGSTNVRDLSNFKGQQLVDGILALLRAHRPLHVSIIGGEPLVRYRELNELLPKMAAMGLYVQVVTSAVRPIPVEWASLRRLQLVVSVDGLQPEHDARRKPATYERILKHIEGHQLTIHNTINRQQLQREGYLEEFVEFWAANPNVRHVWLSLYTPQRGEASAERLTDQDRQRVTAELRVLRTRHPKLVAPPRLIAAYEEPPRSPGDCVFARTTTCLSCDLETLISPCQFGGDPDCASCGCIASGALSVVGRYRLFGRLRVGAIYDASAWIGAGVRRVRNALGGTGRRPIGTLTTDGNAVPRS